MKIIESYTTKNPCYTNAVKITPKGIVLHSIGVNQSKASVLVNNFNKTNAAASVHAFIDANTGETYHCIPWNYKCWHVGGSANSTHIGVEMCEPDAIKYTSGSTLSYKPVDKAKVQKQIKTAYDAAVELFAWLCKQFKLNPNGANVILSHNECGLMGKGSKHNDPEHLWKQTGMSYTMDGFRKDVKAAYDKLVGTTTQTAKPTPATTKKEFKVQITTSDLRIRTGPGTNYASTGKFTGKGVFTIVESQNGSGSKSGWGLLKSYAAKRNGWVSLDYCKKL